MLLNDTNLVHLSNFVLMGWQFDLDQYTIHWTNSWKHWTQDGWAWAIAGLYLIVLIVAIVMFYKFRYRNKFFPFCMIAALVVRIIYMLVLPLCFEEILPLSPLTVFFSNFPVFLMFTCLMVTTFFWAEIFMKVYMDKDVKHKFWLFFKILNGIIYLIAISLFALNFALGSIGSWYQVAIRIWELIVFSMVAVGLPCILCLYCYYIYRHNYYQKLEPKGKHKYMLRRVGVTTIFVEVLWLIRVILHVLDRSLQIFEDFRTAMLYIFLEVFPTALLLVAYIEPRSSTKKLRESTLLLQPEFL